MDSEIVGSLSRIEKLLNNILMAIQVSAMPESPNYRRLLSEYQDFNWASIGATPVNADNTGFVNEVEWNNHRWIRRRSKEDDDFGEAIWFSRQVKDKEYAILIKFADYKVKKLSGDVAEAVTAPPPAQRQAMPPRATVNQVAPPPTEQPALFLWEMRRALQADDAEIKRRLKSLGVTGFPAAHDAAGYAALKARLTQAQAVR